LLVRVFKNIILIKFFIACNKNCFRCEPYVIPANKGEDLVYNNDSKKRKFSDSKNSKLRVKLLSAKATKPKKVPNGYELYRCVINQQTISICLISIYLYLHCNIKCLQYRHSGLWWSYSLYWYRDRSSRRNSWTCCFCEWTWYCSISPLSYVIETVLINFFSN
jgi:hypothetical protein